MNAGVLLSLHGSYEDIFRKYRGDMDRVLEYVVLKEYSERFDQVYLFSHDSKNFEHALPKNCRHVRLYNKAIYLFFGWLVVLIYTLRFRIKILYVECGPALPLTFMVNKVADVVVMLDYLFRWHGSAESGIKRTLIKRLESFLLSFVDYIVVATDEIRKFVNDDKKILDIKTGIVLKEFDPDTEPNDIYKKINGPSIIFVGRLTNVKDPITLLEGYKIAKRSVADLSLIMCGDGELKNTCEKIADKDVHFLGFVKDVPSLLKGADIFVLSSTYDASPRSLMEAMAAGKACIATDVGGVSEYLKGCGILVKPKNPEALAEKIVYLLNNREEAKKLGEKAREKMKKDYDFEKNLDREIEFLLRKTREREV